MRCGVGVQLSTFETTGALLNRLIENDVVAVKFGAF